MPHSSGVLGLASHGVAANCRARLRSERRQGIGKLRYQPLRRKRISIICLSLPLTEFRNVIQFELHFKLLVLRNFLFGRMISDFGREIFDNTGRVCRSIAMRKPRQCIQSLSRFLRRSRCRKCFTLSSRGVARNTGCCFKIENRFGLDRPGSRISRRPSNRLGID